MKNKLTILLLFTSLSLFAQKKGKVKEYHEDLSKEAPTYTYNLDSLLVKADSIEKPLQTEFDITEELKIVSDSISVLNNNIRYIKGYKVLAYSGSSQEVALEIRQKILKAIETVPDFKGTKTDYVWHQPSFRVYIGQYQKRLPAVRMAEFIKHYKFNFEDKKMKINPLVVPDKINIRE